MSDNVNWRGQRLREAAESTGLTSIELGKRLHKTPALIRSWWIGTRAIGLDDLVSYARITQYPVQYFLDESYVLPGDFDVHHQVDRLADEVARLSDRLSQDVARYRVPPALLQQIKDTPSREQKIELAYSYIRSQHIKHGSSAMAAQPTEAKLAIVRLFEHLTGTQLLPEDVV